MTEPTLREETGLESSSAMPGAGLAQPASSPEPGAGHAPDIPDKGDRDMKPGRKLSEIVLSRPDGSPLDLASYSGCRHVLFVWASW